MNLTSSSPTAIVLNPMRDVDDAPGNSSEAALLYRVCLDYGRHVQETLGWTYVPSELQAPLKSGQVKQVIRVTLEMGGFASRLLPGQPKHVLLAAVTQSGEQLLAVPKAFAQTRALLLWAGWGAVALGVPLLLHGFAPAWGTVFLIAGSHAIRTASSIPSVNRVMKVLLHPR